MPLNVDFHQIEEDSQLLMQLPANVWLMDDHKWALMAWEQHRRQAVSQGYALIHADFHWDALDDFSGDEDAQKRLAAAGVDSLRAMIVDNDYIKYDSFIAPGIRRGLLSEVHFYCLQTDSEPLDDSLLSQFGVQQVIHLNVESLAAAEPGSPIIFDLCLDLFNRTDDKEYEGDLWSDREVLDFLESIRRHICAAAVVTISLSFGFSGTKDDTRHLAKLVVPYIIKTRQGSA